MMRRSFKLALVATLPLAIGGGIAASRWLRTQGLTIGELATELQRGNTPRFMWRSVDRKHWQIATTAIAESAEVTDARENTSLGCAPGMVRVRGGFRREGKAITGEIERLQDASCTDWISRDFPARCRVFDREKIAATVARFPAEPMDYCIDRFEYPSTLGAYPVIVVTFHEAEVLCKRAEKRLCTEDEWTFACEGEDVRPYPYGWTRDDSTCVIDRSWRPFGEGALQPRDGDQAREELDRLWQGEPSGSRPGCRSPFGVYDLTGNVDEWTRSVNTTGYASILKGGYWGPVRARCRPSTRAHNEDFVAYQESFRCCAEADRSRDAVPTAGLALPANHDAGSALTPDLVAEVPEDRDEIDAINKKRMTGCSLAHLPRPRGTGLIAFALVLTLALARRLRSSTTWVTFSPAPPATSSIRRIRRTR